MGAAISYSGNDLSPIATLISRNYNADFEISEFEHEATQIIKDTYKECGWMYQTAPTEDVQRSLVESFGSINYTVWSDVYICPHCGNEIVFYSAAADPKTGKVEDSFSCSSCGA